MASDIAGETKYLLGIDLGSASLGWAAVLLDDAGEPKGVLRMGVRIFDPGVTGDFDKGKDESNATARRTARLTRRQLRRRAARQRDLFHLLQDHGLLPARGSAPGSASEQRHAILNRLDKEIVLKWAAAPTERSAAIHDVPLYLLRKKALYGSLDPVDLGRVLYHLSQRRGYKSNRVENEKAEEAEDRGRVEKGICDLEAEIREAGARTLGEFFAGLNPHERRIRGRWTSRAMYEEEFRSIWEKQALFHPEILTAELHREVKRLLFFQRPIRAQANLIGECELEPGERRASWSTIEAQRFRAIQKVNDLEIILPGQVQGIPLTPEQRASLFTLLDESGDQPFKAIRELLGLSRNATFNLQRGGEKTLRGNRVNKLMLEAFGERWRSMSTEEHKRIVDEWRSIESRGAVSRRAASVWGLCQEKADELAQARPPGGYCSLSRKAIQNLMPLLLKGKRFAAAKLDIPEYRPRQKTPLDRIPPVRQVLKNLRNPAVERALTEFRKVMNALVREYGKPTEIRIELARDLKKPRKERERMTETNNKRRKERETAKAKILSEAGNQHPSREDIEKALLWEECGGICPYTGRTISFASLFGPSPQFDVEHIIPLSRLPENSFQNKTLCYHEENRNVKGGRTPFEAYPDPEAYAAILNRVKAWKISNPEKQRRFELRTLEELEGFTSRRLNDTRYASRLACELAGTLYGGDRVPDGKGGNIHVVFASSGMVTATLRRTWCLEAILREPESSANGPYRGKPRSDHRHHAIDALTIALTRQSWIQAMSASASADANQPQNTRAFRDIPSPWTDFVSSVRPHVEQLLVSHRPDRRLNGALHDQTNYGTPRDETGKTIVHIRERVTDLKMTDIGRIVDPKVREAVQAKAEQLGGDLKRCAPEGKAEDWPLLRTRSEKSIPVKRVRVKKTLAVFSVGNDLYRRRYVAPGAGSIHHVAVFVTKDKRGRDKWISQIVSVFEMNRRLAERKKNARPGDPILPLISGTHSEDKNARFLFYLMKKDTVEIEHNGARRIYMVTSFESDGRVNMIPIQAAGKRDDQKGKQSNREDKTTHDPNGKLLLRESLGALMLRVPQKVLVDSLGRKWPVRDKVS